MIPFDIGIILVLFAMLFISMALSNQFLMVLTSFMSIIIGVYLLINGLQSIKNHLITSIGIILVCLGFYLLFSIYINYLETNVKG